jgi:AraC-like DNA-binding protein
MPGRATPDWTAVYRCHVTGIEAYEARWRREASPEHFHPTWQVTLGLSGHAAIRHLGRARVVPPGEPFVFRPWEPHAIGPAGRSTWHFLSVHLADEHVARSPATNGTTGRMRATHLKAAIAATFRAVRRGRGVEQAVALLAAWLASCAGSLPEGRPAPDPMVLAARDQLLAHLDRRVTVAELARAVGTSPGKLARAFRAAVGLSPHAFHIQARIHRAKALLAGGTALAEVAAETGFVDQAHFTRHFARLVRTPPGRWRSGGRNVQDRRRRRAR